MKTLWWAIGGVAALVLSPVTVTADSWRDDVVAPRPKLVTLDYVNAEVTDVIRALSAQSGVNVVLNPSVKGQITVHLRQKTVEEAMTVITNAAGLGAKKINDTYVIAPRAEMRQTMERLGQTRRITLEHLTAQNAADMVQNAFADLTARPQGKAVQLIGAPEDLDAAQKLIQQNDAVSPDEEKVSEKIILKFRGPKEASSSLTKILPGLTVEPAGNALVIGGTRPQVEMARRSLEMIDVAGTPDADSRVYTIKYASAPQLIRLLQQAVPEVLVISGPESYAPPKPAFSPISGKFVGFDVSAAGENRDGTTGPGGAGALLTPPIPGGGTGGDKEFASTTGPINKNALSLLLRGQPNVLEQAMKVLALMDTPPVQMTVEAKIVDTSPEYTANIGVEWKWNPFEFIERPKQSGGATPDTRPLPVGPLGFGDYGRVQFNPTATLNALITDKKAKLLANPSITVINDQDASIFIGDTLRFQALAQSAPTTGAVYTVVEVPVGIILLVHPRVNDDGHITLRVRPVVSTVGNFVNGLPQTSAREAETTVRVKDGDTLVIGGLIREEDSRTITKVPLLGDLPLVGKLFRNDLRNKRRSEIMVFLTIKLNKT